MMEETINKNIDFKVGDTIVFTGKDKTVHNEKKIIIQTGTIGIIKTLYLENPPMAAKIKFDSFPGIFYVPLKFIKKHHRILKVKQWLSK